jgi:hypothetical protein
VKQHARPREDDSTAGDDEAGRKASAGDDTVSAVSSGRKPAGAEKKPEALRGVAACATAKSGDVSARAHDGCTRRRRAAAAGGRCTSAWSRSTVPNDALMARSIASRCSRMAGKGASARMAGKEAGAAARMVGMEAAAVAGADATLDATRERGWNHNRTVGMDAIGRSG